MQNQAIANPGIGARFAGRLSAFAASASRKFLRFSGRAMAIAEKRRQRRALSRLDDRLLRDVGITREQAARETRRLI